MTSAVTQYTTRLLAPETWDDFAALVEANNGVWGGCWCIGFHPEGITKDSTVAGKLAHVNNGTIHQILVYRDARCLAVKMRLVNVARSRAGSPGGNGQNAV